MEDIKKTQLFEQTPVPKAVLKLAVPTVVSSLVMVVYNLVDTYFVGMLNDPVQNAAITLAAPVLLAFNAVNNLFGVGSSSMMSRALGRKDFDTVYKCSAFGFYCALLSGVLFSIAYTAFRTPLLQVLGADSDTLSSTGNYLFWTVTCGAPPAILNVVMAYLVRSEGSSLHASVGTMSGCLLNIILDPIFILHGGLNMGAAGAGLATFIANLAACGYFFVFLLVKRGKTYVCVNPKMFRPQKNIVIGVCAVGIPAAIQNLLNVTGMTVLNNFASDFGADAVAAMGIAQKINMIPMYISMGLGQGIMPLISYNYSAMNVKRMKHTVVFSVKLSMSFIVAVAVCYYIFAAPLTAMFMDNPNIVEYGSAFLRGMCIGLPFLSLDFLAVGIFQACGMGTTSLVFAVMRKVILEIPAIIILNAVFPLYGLAYSQTVAEFVLAIAAVFTVIRIFKKIEKNNA